MGAGDDRALELNIDNMLERIRKERAPGRIPRS